jgi:hypothetical protein
MSTLALLGNYNNGTNADGAEVTSEWLQLINALNATATDKNLITRFSGTDPVYVLDQLSTGRIIELRKSGTARVYIDTNGNLALAHPDVPSITLDNTDTARLATFNATDAGLLDLISDTGTVFSVDLNTRIVTFNQQPVLPQNKTWWSMNWFIADPSTFPLGSFNLAQKVSIPAGSSNFRAQFGRGIFNTGTASGSFSVEIRKHPFNNQTGQTTLGTITFNPGTVGVGQGSVAAIDHTFAADDYIYIVLTARSSPAQRDVSIALTGYQEPTV